MLLTWSTPWPAVYGQRLEVAWPGATSADQATLDLYGGVFATPPYEVDLKPVLRLDGAEVAAGGAIGSAEDVELLARVTPPEGSETVAQFEMFAGEHAVFTVDFGRVPQEVVDRYAAERDAATDAGEEEAWTLALAGALYLRNLGGDLEHLGALRWRRVVKLGNVVLAVQRGGVSRSPDGMPLTFSPAPPAIDLGSMILGLFPPDGVAPSTESTVGTLELLGSEGSFWEGQTWIQVGVGEGITAVTFLTRAVREGQTLTRVDASNVDAALAAAELSAEAEATVRAGVERDFIGWISESQLPVDTWDTTGYVVEDPATGAAGYFVTFERLVPGLGANLLFHSPQDLDLVTASVDVVATIESDQLESWTLSYQMVGEGPAVVIATGDGSVSNTTLGQFDPTLLLNGLHHLVLTGRDAAGQTTSGKISVIVEGNMKIGNFTLSFIDLAIPLSGLDIEIVRTYDSRQRLTQGDFGQGWSLDLRQGSYRNNRFPGDGWQIHQGILPCDFVLESKPHWTTIRLSDREIYHFRLRLVDSAPTLGGCFARAEFDFLDGPVPGARLEIVGNDEVSYANASDRVIDIDSFQLYEPQSVRLITRDQRIFDLDLTDGVSRLEDADGNELTISPEGIFHSTGVALDFVRDAQGRILSITDLLGKTIHYEYDAAGDLIQTTNQVGHSTQFVYDADHRVEDIIDPRGVQGVRTDYDADGRLIGVAGPLGNPTNFEHDLDNNREVVTNNQGFQSVFEYDDRGNVIVEIDEEGNTTQRTYDEEDRLLTERNALGLVTEFTYDSGGNIASVKDPGGNTTSYTYDAMGNQLTTVDPLGRATAWTYSPTGNLLSTRNPLGHETTFAYDATGNLTERTDAMGNTTTSTYDNRGNRTRIVDALGNETSFTYNAAGSQTSQSTSRTLPDGSTEILTTTYTLDDLGQVTATTLPDGSVSRTTYNFFGDELTDEDALSRITQFTYDLAGQLERVTYPDGTSVIEVHDEKGRPISATDRSGRNSSYTYDKTGRLLTVTLADGTVTSATYDALGNILSSTDPDEATTIFSNDTLGRLVETVNALGDRTRFTYDAVGNRIAVQDALDQVTRFEYDDGGQVVKTILPDGGELRAEYDILGRQVAEIDQAGARTEFGYDALGRLIQVTNALGGITRYAYNERNDLISRTDANGHETRFEFDQLSRQTARILPDGSRESFEYDAGGRMVQRTDFNGIVTQYSYGLDDQLLQRSYPDGSTVSFTYTPSRRRATMIDARGTTTYTYDDQDRLIRQSSPEGYELRYVWDASGRRTSLTAELANGTTFGQTYTYDLLGRMRTVTDSRGRTYTYSYDALGNRTSLSYPNGVITSYGYDQARRLVEIQSEDPAGEIIQSFAYQLGVTGTQQSVTEEDGTVRAYSYDPLYRLTRERVTDASGLVYQNSFTYDPAGNRMGEERTADGSVEAIAYTFDSRDLLLTEISANRNVAYSWDLNGNLLSESGPDGVASYAWDHQNRLLGVSRADGTNISHRYDADGVWMGRTVSGGVDTGEARDRRWIVDNAMSMSQVIGQMDDAGNLEAEFARGMPTAGADELLGWLPVGANAAEYHLDALGSVRALSGIDASIQSRHAYSAFGRPLDGSFTQPFGFTGEQSSIDADRTYLRARWLDSRLGRFASQDPFAGFTSEPATFHKYTYARSSPTLYVDPSGQVPWAPFIFPRLNLLGAGFIVKKIPKAAKPIDVSFNARICNTDWKLSAADDALRDAQRIIRHFGIEIKWTLSVSPMQRGPTAVYTLGKTRSIADDYPNSIFLFTGNAEFDGKTAYGFGGHNDEGYRIPTTNAYNPGSFHYRTFYWGSLSSNVLALAPTLARKFAAHEVGHMVTDFGDIRSSWGNFIHSSSLYAYGNGVELSEDQVKEMQEHAKHLP